VRSTHALVVSHQAKLETLFAAKTNRAVVIRTRTQFGKRAFSACNPKICSKISPYTRNLYSALLQLFAKKKLSRLICFWLFLNTSAWFTYSEGWKAELTCRVAGYVPRWFACPLADSHPSKYWVPRPAWNNFV